VTTFPWLEINVLMDDGREFKVMTDQRDQRRAMLPAVYGGAGIRDAELDALGWMRASAWAALVRHHELPDDLSWPDFDAECAFAQPTADDEQVDPPRPTTAGPAS
jgi:hypothetical protein